LHTQSYFSEGTMELSHFSSAMDHGW
jgi:hypothetical protein